MRTHKRMTAAFGSTLLLIALVVGGVGAKTLAPDSTKNATPPPSEQTQPAQSGQPNQPSTPAQPNQPSAPAQGAPATDTKSSDSRTDYRSDTRSERIVETDRTKFLGIDPTLAMIIGAVVPVVIVLAMVSMTRKNSSTTVETRRTL